MTKFSSIVILSVSNLTLLIQIGYQSLVILHCLNIRSFKRFSVLVPVAISRFLGRHERVLHHDRGTHHATSAVRLLIYKLAWTTPSRDLLGVDGHITLKHLLTLFDGVHGRVYCVLSDQSFLFSPILLMVEVLQGALCLQTLLIPQHIGQSRVICLTWIELTHLYIVMVVIDLAHWCLSSLIPGNTSLHSLAIHPVQNRCLIHRMLVRVHSKVTWFIMH